MASAILSGGTKDTTEADNELKNKCDECGEDDDKSARDENDGHLSKRQLRKLKKQEKWQLIKADKRYDLIMG